MYAEKYFIEVINIYTQFYVKEIILDSLGVSDAISQLKDLKSRTKVYVGRRNSWTAPSAPAWASFMGLGLA